MYEQALVCFITNCHLFGAHIIKIVHQSILNIFLLILILLDLKDSPVELTLFSVFVAQCYHSNHSKLSIQCL